MSSPTEPGSSSQSTLLSNNGNPHIKTPEAPASLDDLLKSPHNPALTPRQPSSTLKGAPPNDDRRRNGFHLWRTESEDARNARLRQAAAEAEARASAPPSLPRRIGSKLQNASHWLTSRGFFSLYRRHSIHSSAPTTDQSDFSLHSIREPKLTRLGLIILTISLAGAQVAWTLELAYGTPYLLSLGLSEQSTSLVWLAGPLSGLIAQPVVGSLSDHSTSSFRRRKYMLISATLLTLSTLTLAYSVPISTVLVDLTGGGLGSWDPHRHELVHSTTQIISVLAFWILDFALNGLQAASRALILDTAPSEQQSIANAWQGRMTHAGNVVGYLCGWVDLASWKGLNWLGGGQFRRFAMISLLAMISCVSVTVGFIGESPADTHFAHQREQSSCGSALRKAKETFTDVWHAIRRLPRSVRRVCLVQLFAFMGWFPFLFYGTTYVLQIAQYERNLKRQQRHHDDFGLSAFYQEDGGDSQVGHPSSDRDAERGSFAMLLFAVVSLIAGALLPYLALAGEHKGDTDSPQTPSSSSSTPLYLNIPHSDPEDSTPAHDPESDDHLSRTQRLLRPLISGLTLRTFWTLASVTFAILMLVGTAWASTVHQATIVIALVGVPWSIAAWAPFAMVGEFVREAEGGESPFEFEDDHWSPVRTRERSRKQRRESASQAASQEGFANGELTSPDGAGRKSFPYIDGGGEQGARARIRASLVRCEPLPHTLTHSSSSSSLHPPPPRSHSPDTTPAGGAGTILGIHNLAIVVPQFVVAIISSLIFSAVNSKMEGIHLVLDTPLAFGEVAGEVSNPAEGTIWVLRFGGAMAILAALATRFVPLTLSERKRRYGGELVREEVFEEEQD